MKEHYHHGITIREYRQKRGMTQLELAELWPTGPVNLRYVQYIEKGAKQIVIPLAKWITSKAGRMVE